MRDKKVVSKLAGMAEKSPKLHTMNHDYGFNFNHNTLMQKLLNNEIIQTPFWIHPDDYFRSLIALDYYVNILFNDKKPLENLEYVFEEKSSDEERFELTESVVAKELYMSIVDRLYELPLESRVNQIKDKYEKNNIIFDKKAKPSVYYKIIGEMIKDLVSENNRKYLKKAGSLNDIRALVFFDFMQDYSRSSNKIKSYLNRGEFMHATLELMSDITKNIAKLEEEELSKAGYIKTLTDSFTKESTQTLVTLISETGLDPDLIEKGLNFLIEKNVLAKSENYINGTVYYLKHPKGDKNGTKQS